VKLAVRPFTPDRFGGVQPSEAEIKASRDELRPVRHRDRGSYRACPALGLRTGTRRKKAGRSSPGRRREAISMPSEEHSPAKAGACFPQRCRRAALGASVQASVLGGRPVELPVALPPRPREPDPFPEALPLSQAATRRGADRRRRERTWQCQGVRSAAEAGLPRMG